MNLKKNGVALTALMLLMLLPVYAYAVTVTVTTDKTSYKPGESLVVRGVVSPVEAGQDVSIIVYSPLMEPKAFGQATPAADGTYSTTVMVFRDEDPSGIWTVQATYKGTTNSATFEFVGKPVVPPKTAITLEVSVDVGSVYYLGDTAELYVLTSYQGKAVEANLTAPSVYGPTALTATVSKVAGATGLFKITLSVPSTAKLGTYALVVSASHESEKYEGSGTALKTFMVSPKPTTAEDISGMKTDLGALKTDLGALKNETSTIKSDVAAAKKSASDAATAAAGAKSAVEAMSGTLYAAVILALIAAVAAVVGVIQITRKIAG
ncbi:hypothetical protein KEJ34_09340 [Candidatus Bathyarchaeota archaeon]|nr:hypothetical protein [Candidatus Bathyarchaeota archaeon]